MIQTPKPVPPGWEPPVSKKLPDGWRIITTHFSPVTELDALMACARGCIVAGQAPPEEVMIYQPLTYRAYVILMGPEPPRIEGQYPQYGKLPKKEKLHEAIRRLGLTKAFKRIATAHASEDDLWDWLMGHEELRHFKRPYSLRGLRDYFKCPSAHGGHRAPKKKPVQVLNLSHC